MNLKLLCVHRGLGEARWHHVVFLLIILLWEELHRWLLIVLILLVQKLIKHVVLVLRHHILAHLGRTPRAVVVPSCFFFLRHVLELKQIG